MTHHTKITNIIKDYLYRYYIIGQEDSSWNEADANQSAQNILTSIEKLQNTHVKFNQWRASD